MSKADSKIDDWKDPVIEFYKKKLDMTQTRANLKLTVPQRLAKLMEMQRVAEELQRAGKDIRDGMSFKALLAMRDSELH